MFESQKTKKPKAARTSASAKRKAKLAEKLSKKELDKHYQMNANSFIGHMMNIFRSEGLDSALITILKTVRPWPSLFDKAGPEPFVPPFSATDISAEEVTEDEDNITSVSFSYLGKTYDYVARINQSAPDKRQPGTITLYENGDRVVEMEFMGIQGHYNFQGLRAFRMGEWSDHIIRIEQEIESSEAEAE